MTERPPSLVSGAYGLAFPDLPTTPNLLPADDQWPSWEVRWEQPAGAIASPQAESWDEERATLVAHPAGRALIERRECRTTLVLAERPTLDAVVHPYLASTAVIAGQWLGRASFHAGAFAVGGRVWGLLGGRSMGKTSTLLRLHEMGVPIVADDVLVVEEGMAYSGPRCLDLREDVAARTGRGRYIGMAGSRERWRVDLPALTGRMPMGGWISLAWADAGTDISSLPAACRMAVLVRNRGLLTPGAPIHSLLDLLTLPAVSFSRQPDWELGGAALDRLLDAIVRY